MRKREPKYEVCRICKGKGDVAIAPPEMNKAVLEKVARQGGKYQAGNAAIIGCGLCNGTGKIRVGTVRWDAELEED